MVAIPNMNWMGNEPTGSAYDVYRYYMGGGNPDANAGGGGGGGTTGIMQAFPTSGGDGGFNPYSPNANVNTNYTPNYDFRQFSEYGANPSTMDRKQMDMNQEFFYGKTPSALQRKMSNIMNFIPGVGAFKRGAEFLGDKLQGILPVNQRAIFENELRGSGVYTDDIGRIAIGPDGKYNTPEGIMAGYNANQMTDKTFDKRTGKISETLGNKYGISTEDIQGIMDGTISDEEIEAKYGITTNLTSNLKNINLAKKNWQKKKEYSNKIAEYEKQKREEKKKEKAAAKSRAESKRQYDPNKHGPTNYGLGSDGKQSYDTGQGFGAHATSGGPVSNRTGRGRTDWAEGGMIDPDLSKDAEYLGWKKVYKMNPELGSMHEKHPTFIKFYKKHERDQKKFGGLAGLLYG